MNEALNSSFYVVNGGMGGWGIDSEIKWFFKTCQPYQPKYVVLQFAVNDPSDSFSGVTTVENGEFKFNPYPYQKPAWLKFLSRSSIIQHSHLYSALRNILDKIANKDGNNNSESKSDDWLFTAQENYIKMLDLFAVHLKEEGIQLIYISVTHKYEDLYRYDLDHFPLIKDKIELLNMTGALHFVDLPLEQMASLPGSPEGHQWSAAHHELIGKALATKILKLETETVIR